MRTVVIGVLIGCLLGFGAGYALGDDGHGHPMHREASAMRGGFGGMSAGGLLGLVVGGVIVRRQKREDD